MSSKTLNGILLKGIGGFYSVEAADAVYVCKARGVFRKKRITPLCGDRVQITVSNGDNENTIDEIFPRKNELRRPPVANIDQLMIVVSTTAPRPNALVIDKLIALAEQKEIEPIVVFTKTDIAPTDALFEVYRGAGIPCFSVFKTITANLAFGIDWTNDDNLAIFVSQLKTLADFYLDNPTMQPADILNMQIEAINPKKRNVIQGYCGAGSKGMVAYEIDGTAYPCHTFAPVSAGNDIARKALTLKFENEISVNRLDKKCRNCVVASICPNCYGINFCASGNIYKKDDAFCRMIKAQFLANAYFKYRQYEAGLLKLTPEEEYRLLNNISLVQNLEI